MHNLAIAAVGIFDRKAEEKEDTSISDQEALEAAVNSVHAVLFILFYFCIGQFTCTPKISWLGLINRVPGERGDASLDP